ncbi:hypothetical protein GCM10023083_79850 [Streptomyces phyllanthi]
MTESVRNVGDGGTTHPVGMRLNQIPADSGGSSGAQPGGFSGSRRDLASSPAEKRAAARAIEEHIEPDTRKSGDWTDEETNTAVKAFAEKDGHGWVTRNSQDLWIRRGSAVYRQSAEVWELVLEVAGGNGVEAAVPAPTSPPLSELWTAHNRAGQRAMAVAAPPPAHAPIKPGDCLWLCSRGDRADGRQRVSLLSMAESTSTRHPGGAGREVGQCGARTRSGMQGVLLVCRDTSSQQRGPG